MALILSEDNRSLILVDNEPPTRAKLLSNSQFCDDASTICSYFESLPYYRNKTNQSRVFIHSYLQHQIDTVMTEKQNGEEPFSIDSWYMAISSVENNIPNHLQIAQKINDSKLYKTEKDFFSPLIDQELKTPGFASTLRNCIDMEDQLQQKSIARIGSSLLHTNNGRAIFTRPGNVYSVSKPKQFFSHGGVLAPNRK